LKHGRGKSYNILILKNGGTLNAQIKKPDEDFFFEGDVSEINTLIDVNEKFLNHCTEVIRLVCEAIENN